MEGTRKDIYRLIHITVPAHTRKLKSGKICNVSPYVRKQLIRKSKRTLIDLDAKKGGNSCNMGNKDVQRK